MFSNGLKPPTRFAFSGELGLTKNGRNMNKQGLFVGRWRSFKMVLTLPCVCGRWDIQKKTDPTFCRTCCVSKKIGSGKETGN